MQASRVGQKKAQDLECEGRVGIPAHSLSSPGSGWILLLFQIHCLPCLVRQGSTSMDYFLPLLCHLSSGRSQPKEDWRKTGLRTRLLPRHRSSSSSGGSAPGAYSSPVTAFRSHWAPGTLDLPFALVASTSRRCRCVGGSTCHVFLSPVYASRKSFFMETT